MDLRIAEARRLVALESEQHRAGPAASAVDERRGLRGEPAAERRSRYSQEEHRAAPVSGERLRGEPTAGYDNDFGALHLADEEQLESVVKVAARSQVAARSPLLAWLSAQRLERFLPSLSALGVAELADIVGDLTAADLEASGMATLHIRRFVAAAAQLPEEAELPLGASVSDWLGTLRLKRFAASLEALGVEEAEDFEQCSDEDLLAMGMPEIQRRRFRRCVPKGGGLAAAARAASARAAGAAPGQRIAGWLAALRLQRFGPLCEALGCEELEDLAEVEAAKLASMKPLQARRFALAAERIAQLPGGPPVSPSAALAAAAAAASLQSAPLAWLDALRLGGYAAGFGSLGVQAAYDFREVTERDIERLGLPPLQRARFAAAVAASPGPPPPSRRDTAQAQAGDGAAWLNLLRLGSRWSAFSSLGVEKAACLHELLDPFDYDVLALPPLQRRRLAAALRTLPRHPESALAKGGARLLLEAEVEDWLLACRCEAYAPAFAQLGVVCAEDVAEVLLSDLERLQLPLLHRRRFAALAAETAAALSAAGRALADARSAARMAASPEQWLRLLRLERAADAFAELGVERVDDFCEVTLEDLRPLGLRELEVRRWSAAVADLARRRR